jgi:signal transduction histidine kinase
MIKHDTYKGFSLVRSPRVKRLIILSVVTMLLVAGIIFVQALEEYKDTSKQGEIEASRLSSIVADQVEQGIQAVDLSLQHAVERQHLNMLFGGALPEDLVHNFKLWVDSLPQTVAMVMLDEKGFIELAVNKPGYKNWIEYEESLADFLPFRLLKNEEAPSHVVMPYTSGSRDVDGLIIVARRVSKLDGTFGGIVMAAVNPEFFLEFYASIHNGTHRTMNLMLQDGTSMFRNVANHHVSQDIDKIKQYIDMSMVDKTEGVFDIMLQKQNYKTAYRTLTTLPITAIVMISEQDYLHGFWNDRLKDLLFLFIFIIFGSVVSFFVITMAKQVARVEESEASAILASQAKSEFLANMSHELRTPLNAIIGFSEMMTAGYFGPLNAKQKERMTDINMCGNHLLHLISDILEFSKGEAGKLEIVEEKVNVPMVIDETLRMMNEKIKSKSISTYIEANSALPLLFADKRKLKQILINIISNAVKFTPTDGRIDVSASINGTGNMVISIKDTGIGIAEDDIQTALSVFGQVHRSQNHEGTGLGLPLCRMFTELHGGKFQLTSVLGEGTTVKIIFPEQRIIEDNRHYQAV